MKTKLTEIIQHGIDKGFSCFGWKDKYPNPGFKWEVWDCRIQRQEGYLMLSVSDGDTEFNYYSIADIIFSPSGDYMQKVFGEEIKEVDCVHQTRTKNCPVCKKDGLTRTVNKGYQYHKDQLTCLDSEEAWVDYIWDYIKDSKQKMRPFEKTLRDKYEV
ncbi:hypothetical protein LCGC14_2273020 [marine sediment metagenome]|uniref:Uncharacterized protein n=1 Tax=marine sediment metagenome TaxID=412755 RepID=A0A0F9F8X8_9ZZZZ